MGDLRLYAIGIDEVRDMFAASPEDSARFRAIAAERFSRPPTPYQRSSGGLLGVLGPLFRRPLIDAGPVRASGIAVDEPNDDDVTTLLAGHFIAPERLPASWRLLETWIAETSWGRLQQTLPAGVSDLDFALARAGLPSPLGLQRLLDKEAGITLHPVAGLQAGYAKHSHALAMHEAWDACLPGIDDEGHRSQAALIAEWLTGYLGWTRDAATAGRPAPDLFALFSG